MSIQPYSDPFGISVDTSHLYDAEKDDNRDSGILAGGIESGIYGLGKSFNDALAAASRSVGADSFAAGRERAADEYAARAAGAGHMIPSFDDALTGPGDFAGWGAGTLAQNLPLLGTIVGGSVLGGAAGAALGRRSSVAKDIGELTRAKVFRNTGDMAAAAKAAMEAEQNALKQSRITNAVQGALGGSADVRIGRHAGVALPYFAATTGETYGGIRGDPGAEGTPQEFGRAALLSGLGQAALGTLLEPVDIINYISGRKARKLGNNLSVSDLVLGNKKRLLGPIGLGVAATLGEGATEATEQLIQQYTQNQFNPNAGYDPKELLAAGLGGAIVGGTYALPSAIAGKVQERQDPTNWTTDKVETALKKEAPDSARFNDLSIIRAAKIVEAPDNHSKEQVHDAYKFVASQLRAGKNNPVLPPLLVSLAASGKLTERELSQAELTDEQYEKELGNELARIQAPEAQGVALKFPTYNDYLQASAGSEAVIPTEEDFKRLQNEEIDLYVEDPAKPLVRQVLAIGGTPVSSNAFGPGAKGVDFLDADGNQQFVPLSENLTLLYDTAVKTTIEEGGLISERDVSARPNEAPNIHQHRLASYAEAAKKRVESAEPGTQEHEAAVAQLTELRQKTQELSSKTGQLDPSMSDEELNTAIESTDNPVQRTALTAERERRLNVVPANQVFSAPSASLEKEDFQESDPPSRVLSVSTPGFLYDKAKNVFTRESDGLTLELPRSIENLRWGMEPIYLNGDPIKNQEVVDAISETITTHVENGESLELGKLFDLIPSDTTQLAARPVNIGDKFIQSSIAASNQIGVDVNRDENGEIKSVVLNRNDKEGNPTWRLAEIPPTLDALFEGKIKYKGIEVDSGQIKEKLAKAYRHGETISASELLDEIQKAYEFRLVERPRGTISVSQSRKEIEGDEPVVVENEEFKEQTGLKLRESPLVREYGLHSFKVKGNFSASLSRLVTYMAEKGMVFAGSMDNQVFFATKENRDRFVKEASIFEALKDDINLFERMGVLEKKESGDSVKVDLSHIKNKHRDKGQDDRIHDGTIAIVRGQPIAQGISVRKVPIRLLSTKSEAEATREVTTWWNALSEEERIEKTKDISGFSGDYKSLSPEAIDKATEAYDNEHFYYEYDKGIIRSPLRRKIAFKDSGPFANKNWVAEKESVNQSLQLKKQRTKLRDGSDLVTFHRMFPVAAQRGGTANLQQNAFGAENPVRMFKEDRLIKDKLQASSMMNANQRMLHVLGRPSSTLVDPDMVFGQATKTEAGTSRAYVMSSTELLTKEANDATSIPLTESQKAKIDEAFSKVNREYEEGLDDLLLLQSTYDELNEAWIKQNGVPLEYGDVVILHRDPALPDATSMAPFVYRGLAEFETPEGSHNRGIVVHPKGAGWEEAAGDFDGDSGVVMVPREGLWPKPKLQSQHVLTHLKKGAAVNDSLESETEKLMDILIEDAVSMGAPLPVLNEQPNYLDSTVEYTTQVPEYDDEGKAKRNADGTVVYKTIRVKADLLSAIAAARANEFSQMIGRIMTMGQKLSELGLLDMEIAVPEFDPKTGRFVEQSLGVYNYINAPVGVVISALGQSSISAKKKAAWAAAALEVFTYVEQAVADNTPPFVDPRTGDQIKATERVKKYVHPKTLIDRLAKKWAAHNAAVRNNRTPIFDEATLKQLSEATKKVYDRMERMGLGRPANFDDFIANYWSNDSIQDQIMEGKTRYIFSKLYHVRALGGIYWENEEFPGVESYLTADFKAVERAARVGSDKAKKATAEARKRDADNIAARNGEPLVEFRLDPSAPKGYTGIPVNKKQAWQVLMLHANRVVSAHRGEVSRIIFNTYDHMAADRKSSVDTIAGDIAEQLKLSNKNTKAVFRYLNNNPDVKITQDLLDRLNELEIVPNTLHHELAYRAFALDRLYTEMDIFSGRELLPEFVKAAQDISGKPTAIEQAMINDWDETLKDINLRLEQLDPLSEVDESERKALQDDRANINGEIATAFLTGKIPAATLIGYGKRARMAAIRAMDAEDLQPIAERTKAAGEYKTASKVFHADGKTPFKNDAPWGVYNYDPKSDSYILAYAYNGDNAPGSVVVKLTPSDEVNKNDRDVLTPLRNILMTGVGEPGDPIRVVISFPSQASLESGIRNTIINDISFDERVAAEARGTPIVTEGLPELEDTTFKFPDLNIQTSFPNITSPVVRQGLESRAANDVEALTKAQATMAARKPNEPYPIMVLNLQLERNVEANGKPQRWVSDPRDTNVQKLINEVVMGDTKKRLDSLSEVPGLRGSYPINGKLVKLKVNGVPHYGLVREVMYTRFGSEKGLKPAVKLSILYLGGGRAMTDKQAFAVLKSIFETTFGKKQTAPTAQTTPAPAPIDSVQDVKVGLLSTNEAMVKEMRSLIDRLRTSAAAKRSEAERIRVEGNAIVDKFYEFEEQRLPNEVNPYGNPENPNYMERVKFLNLQAAVTEDAASAWEDLANFSDEDGAETVEFIRQLLAERLVRRAAHDRGLSYINDAEEFRKLGITDESGSWPVEDAKISNFFENKSNDEGILSVTRDDLNRANIGLSANTRHELRHFSPSEEQIITDYTLEKPWERSGSVELVGTEEPTNEVMQRYAELFSLWKTNFNDAANKIKDNFSVYKEHTIFRIAEYTQAFKNRIGRIDAEMRDIEAKYKSLKPKWQAAIDKFNERQIRENTKNLRPSQRINVDEERRIRKMTSPAMLKRYIAAKEAKLQGLMDENGDITVDYGWLVLAEKEAAEARLAEITGTTPPEASTQPPSGPIPQSPKSDAELLKDVDLSTATKKRIQDAADNLAMLMNISGGIQIINATEAHALLSRQHPNDAADILKHAKAHDAKTTGGARGMHFIDQDGKHFIYISNAVSNNEKALILGHELGHALIDTEWFKLGNSRADIQTAIFKDYLAAKNKPGDLTQADVRDAISNSKEFQEWLADRIAHWFITSDKPKTAGDTWFTKIANKLANSLRAMQNALKKFFNLPAVPAELASVDRWMRFVAKTPNELVRAYGNSTAQGQTLKDRLALKQLRLKNWFSDKTNPDIEALNEVVDDVVRQGLDNLLGVRDVALLRDMAFNPEVQKRLFQLLGENSEAAKRAGNNVDYAVAYLYTLSTAGVMQPSPKAKGLFKALNDNLRQVNRRLLEATPDEVNEVIDRLNQLGNQAVKNTSVDLIPSDSPAARLYKAKNERYSAGMLGMTERATQAYRNAFGWWLNIPYDRILAFNVPKLTETARALQAVAWELNGMQKAGVVERAKVVYGMLASRAAEVIVQLSENEKIEMKKILYPFQPDKKAGKIKPTAKLQKVRDEIRDILGSAYNYAISTGLNVPKRADYWPFMPDYDYIRDNIDTVVDLYTSTNDFKAGWDNLKKQYIEWIKSNKDPGNERNVADAVALVDVKSIDEFAKFYLEQDDRHMLPGWRMSQLKWGRTTTPGFRFQNPRALDFLLQSTDRQTHERVVETLQSDMTTVMHKYIRNISKRGEHQMLLNSLGPKGFESVWEEAIKQGATREQIDYVVQYVDAIHGMLGIRDRDWLDDVIAKRGPNSWFRHFSSGGGSIMNKRLNDYRSAIMAYTDFAHLTLSAFTSMADPFAHLAQTGNFKGFLKAVSEVREAAKREAAGLSPDQKTAILNAANIMTRDFIQKDLMGTYAGPDVSKPAQKAMNWFFTMNGTIMVSEFATSIAARAGYNEIIIRKQLAEEGGPEAEEARKYLARLGIAPEDVELIPGTDGNEFDIKLMSWDEASKTLEEMRSEDRDVAEEARKRWDRELSVRTALQRSVERGQIHPGATLRPLRMSNPYRSLLDIWRPFITAYDNMIIKPTWAKLIEDGKAGPLALLALTTIPVMFFSDLIRDQIKSAFDGDDNEDWLNRPRWKAEWTLTDHILYAIERAGFYGSAELVADVIDPVLEGNLSKAATEAGGVIASDAYKAYKWGDVPLPLGDVIKWGA